MYCLKKFTTNISLKGEVVEIVDYAKLLGVIVSSDLKWEKNTNHIIKNANKMMKMLHIASKFTRNQVHLENIYKTFVRSRLEYASTLWHSSLTVANRNERADQIYLWQGLYDFRHSHVNNIGYRLCSQDLDETK